MIIIKIHKLKIFPNFYKLQIPIINMAKRGRNKSKWLAVLPGIILAALLMLVISLFLIKILWAWTIPDLFPAAVSQGLISSSISWLTSFKLALFIAVLAGVAGARYHKNY